MSLERSSCHCLFFSHLTWADLDVSDARPPAWHLLARSHGDYSELSPPDHAASLLLFFSGGRGHHLPPLDFRIPTCALFGRMQALPSFACLDPGSAI